MARPRRETADEDRLRDRSVGAWVTADEQIAVAGLARLMPDPYAEQHLTELCGTEMAAVGASYSVMVGVDPGERAVEWLARDRRHEAIGEWADGHGVSPPALAFDLLDGW